MAGYELATAYVTLAVESSQISKAIGAGFAGGDKVAAKSGKSMGKAMGDAFSKEKGPDFDKLADDAAKADKRVQASAEQVARKRSDAARQVEIAEQKVLETREKSIARDRDVVNAEKQLAAARKQGDPDDVAAAEDRLARARDAAAPTSADMAAEDRLAKAKRSYIDVSRDGVQTLSRFAQEQDQANTKLKEARRAADDADRSTDKAAGAFARMGDRVKAAMQGDFKGAFRRVERDGEDAAEEIERDFKRSGNDSARGFGSNFKSGLAGALGGLTAYFGLSEALDLGKFAVSGAADLEQSIGGVQTVFKDSANQMLAWSEAADQSLGLTENEYNEFAAKLGASLKNAGTPMDELGGKTNDLIAMGADLASLYGGTTAEAVDALGSALRGEMDPIERYGISLNDAALTAEGLAMGIEKTGGSFSTQEKQLISMSLLQKQSADATGNFAREQDTASNVAQRLTAKLKETATEVGGRLTPFLADLGSWFLDKGIPALEDFGGSIGSLWDLMVNGNFDGNLFGLEEDDPIVGNLLDLREAVLDVVDEWGNVVQSIDWSGLLEGAKGVGEWFLNDGIPALTDFVEALAELPGWISQNQAWLITLGVSLGVAGAAAWIASGGLTAVGLSIKGVFLSISTGIKSIPVIGWVIAAIGLLVTALVWFFTQTEVGQEIWAKVWSGIKTAAGAVVEWFTGTAWPALKAAWDAIAGAAVWLWQNVMVPAWNGIMAAVSAVIGWVTGTAVPWLQSAWQAIASAAQWLWQNVIQPVWDGIRLAIAVAVTAVLAYIDLLKWYWSSVLAPVAMWLWNNVIKPVWAGIQSAIGAVVTWFTGTAWPILKAAWNAVAAAAMWLWRNVLQPAWNGIRSAISAVVTWFRDTAWPLLSTVIGWIATKFDQFKLGLSIIWSFIRNNVIGPVVSWFRDTVWPIFSNIIGQIRDRFSWFRDRLGEVWSFIRDSIINPVVNWFMDTVKPKIDDFIGKVKDGFTGLKDGVLKAWDGIRDGLKKPVNGVIGIYNDHIAGNFNKVIETIFGKDGGEKYKLSEMTPFATGGILPGRSSWRDGDDQIISARRGEGVLVSEGLRDRESQSLFLRANHAARTRGTSFANFVSGAFAGGGIVKLRSPFSGSYPRGDGFGARGRRHKGIDWPMPSGAILKAVGAGSVSHSWNPSAGKKLELSIGNGLVAGYHHLSSYIAGRGAQVAAGADVARVGSTGRSSGPHLHFSLKRDGKYVDPLPYLGSGGAAGTGESGSWWNPFDGLWSSIKEKVASAVGEGTAGSMVSKVVENTIGGIGDWVTGKLGEFGDWGMEQVDGAVQGVKATRWTPVATQALSMEGAFSGANLQALLRRMNQESGFNPRAVNDWDSNARAGTPSKGLMQVIPPTFRAYARPGYDKDIFDPLSNILASIRYTRATYPSLAAGWNRKGGYALGGIVDKPFLYDNGGWLNPGELSISQTQKPEAVLTDSQWRTMARLAEENLAEPRGGDTWNIYGGDAEEAAERAYRKFRRVEALRAKR